MNSPEAQPDPLPESEPELKVDSGNADGKLTLINCLNLKLIVNLVIHSETLPEEPVHPPEEEERPDDKEPYTPLPETGRLNEESALSAEPEARKDNESTILADSPAKAEAKTERIRHYNREDIRKYMAKQKKSRKSASGSPNTHVCNHTRSSPMRIDTGIKVNRKTAANRKPTPSTEQPPKFRIPVHEENWGPYESPKTLPLPAFPAPEVIT